MPNHSHIKLDMQNAPIKTGTPGTIKYVLTSNQDTNTATTQREANTTNVHAWNYVQRSTGKET
jgi:hypothetical protein